MKFIWPESARAELRGLDREIAIRILHALTEYGESGAGDIKALAGQWRGHFRIRVGTTVSSSRSRRMKLRLSGLAIGRTFIDEFLAFWDAAGKPHAWALSLGRRESTTPY